MWTTKRRKIKSQCFVKNIYWFSFFVNFPIFFCFVHLSFFFTINPDSFFNPILLFPLPISPWWVWLQPIISIFTFPVIEINSMEHKPITFIIMKVVATEKGTANQTKYVLGWLGFNTQKWWWWWWWREKCHQVNGVLMERLAKIAARLSRKQK